MNNERNKAILAAVGARGPAPSQLGQEVQPYAVADVSTGTAAVAAGALSAFSDTTRSPSMLSATPPWSAQTQAAYVMPVAGWSALTPEEQSAILTSYQVRFTGSGGQYIDVPLSRLWREQTVAPDAAGTGFVGTQAWPADFVQLPYPVSSDGSIGVPHAQLKCNAAITPGADVEMVLFLQGAYANPQSPVRVATSSC